MQVQSARPDGAFSSQLQSALSPAQGANAIVKILKDPSLYKNLLSISKTMLDKVDKTVVNKIASEISRVAIGVPFIGVGIAAVSMIVGNMALAEDNKEKRNEIVKYVNFLGQLMQGLLDNEDVNELHRQLIVIVTAQACVLEKEKKWSEGCVRAFCSRLCGVTFAHARTATLDNMARQLRQLHDQLNTVVLKAVDSRVARVSKAPPALPRDVIGLDERKQEVMSFLNQPAGVLVVGVYGIGGIGKSTLLKAIRSDLQEQGKHEMAWIEMRDQASGMDMDVVKLQQDILFQWENRRFEITDTAQGRTLITNCLKTFKERSKPVCLIIDNVWKEEHMTEMLPEDIRDLLPAGSRLIMSTRAKHQAEAFGRLCSTRYEKQAKLYEPPLLNEEQALWLFRKKAEAAETPLQNEELVKGIVPLCGGLPLAVQVYGSYFRAEKKRDNWRAVQKLLQEAEDTHSGGRIFERLELSITLQPADVQEAFMDAASFWRGKNWNEATLALYDRRGEDLLAILQEQSLLDEENGVVKVHDLMAAVGKKRAREKFTYVRATSAATTALTSQISKNDVRGFSYEDMELDLSELLQMKQLRFLELTKCRLHSSVLDTTRLVIPRWILVLLLFLLLAAAAIVLALYQRYLGPLRFFLLSIVLFDPIIIILLLVFHREQLMPNRIALPPDLTFLTLLDCVNISPLTQSIGSLSQLRFLNLSHNHDFTNLPSSVFTNLISVLHVDLSFCELLRSLPSSFGNMTSLRVLDLSSCPQLQKLPISLGKLYSLQSLNLSNCHLLDELPSSLGDLKNLEKLHLSNCDQLKELPSSLGKLTSLQYLNLSESDKLTRLPYSISGLVSLKHLNLSRCDGLRELPPLLGNLKSLETLTLSHCGRLTKLPDSIGQLASLRMLDLSFCKELHEVPDSLGSITTLQNLDVSFCQKLCKLPTLYGTLGSLKVSKIGTNIIEN